MPRTLIKSVILLLKMQQVFMCHLPSKRDAPPKCIAQSEINNDTLRIKKKGKLNPS
jgi:hypothetical protein